MSISPYMRSLSPHSMLVSINFYDNPLGGIIPTATFLASCTTPGPLYSFLQEYTRVHGVDLSGLGVYDSTGSHIRSYAITGVQTPYYTTDHRSVDTHITFVNTGLNIHTIWQSITGSLWTAQFELRLLQEAMR
jgi:hypothetical protein